jgi:ATP-dependent DNA helicase RecG
VRLPLHPAFIKADGERKRQTTGQVTPEVTPEVRRIIQHLEGDMLRRDIQAAKGLKDDEHFRKGYLLPALEAGIIEMIESPRRR